MRPWLLGLAFVAAAAAGPLSLRAQEDLAAAAARDAASAAAEADYAVSAGSSLDRRISNPMKLSERKLLAAAAKLDPLESYRSYTPEFIAWNDELMRGIKRGSLAAATAGMAARLGIPEAAMQALSRDWLIARIGNYDLGKDGELAPVRPAFTDQVLRDVAAAGHAPFTIEIAARALDEGGDCDDPGYTAIQSAAPDKPLAAWAMARGSVCPALGFAALASPDRRTTVLLRLMLTGDVKGLDALPILEVLRAPGGLAAAAAADTPRLRVWLARNQIDSLLGAGMGSEALARFDALDPGLRSEVLSPVAPAFIAAVDGARLAFDEDRQSLRLRLAAALVLGARGSEAEVLLAGDHALADSPKLLDCLYAAQSQPTSPKSGKDQACGLGKGDNDRKISDAITFAYLREAISKAGTDLYPLVELSAGYLRNNTADGILIALRCHELAEPQYAAQCREDRRRAADSLRAAKDRDRYQRKEAEPILAALGNAGLPGWDSIMARNEALRAATLAAFADPDGEPRKAFWSERPPVDPDPSPFPEKPLAPQLRSSPQPEPVPPPWPLGWAQLPAGFDPLRTGKAGTLAVAVSTSSRLDPSGEVGRGAYWVHVSRDGGKTWQAPLYTGLAAYFPYVVPAQSKLQLLDGETIRLEVTVDLLDTRSITYPPVGLRTRRTARDLYLELPLAALEADSDGDGLTNIAAKHLLMDQAAPLKPFVVGSDLPSCPASTPPAAELRARLLQRLVGGRQEAAVLEPINRPKDALLGFDWAKSPDAKTGPLFIKGTAADFACIRLPFPALVYSDAGEQALQRKSPDFRLLELPPIIMNRAGTRGFAVWSFGWTGGTTLFVQGPDGGWHSVELSSWIT
ncbi:hypothetical protein NSE01_16510 [Novosphingobium sediminis]|uniref:Uncharacterized protein n=1 Tax=Novosphingobium sediminis TaxID=707214 RepID=A0A512AJE1_9SPHN|nr:hypothetical protein [Novosphingobium sediminis]GEN99818.1 hypothetical protein NSE01_16510 [Novosphingobium sediminis]